MQDHEKEVGKLVLTQTFEQGDIICARANYAIGLHIFFVASDSDVEDYSNRGNLYYKIILN